MGSCYHLELNDREAVSSLHHFLFSPADWGLGSWFEFVRCPEVAFDRSSTAGSDAFFLHLRVLSTVFLDERKCSLGQALSTVVFDTRRMRYIPWHGVEQGGLVDT